MDSCNKVSSCGYSPIPTSADERGGRGLGAPSKDGTGGGFAASVLVGAFSLSDVDEPWLESSACVDNSGEASLRGCGGAGGSDGVGNCERTICRFL